MKKNRTLLFILILASSIKKTETMFGHRSFLVLGAGSGTDILSLIREGYEISKFSFSFQQGTDEKGRVTTRVYAGSIHIVLPQLPPQPILEWAIRPRKYTDGVIVQVDDQNVPLQKIFFKNAVCASFHLEYTEQGKSYSTTRIVIQAEKLTVGNGINFESEWIV